MNTEHRYILQHGSKKHLCPDCGKRTFVPYLDTTGEPLPEQYGRCDREINCAYHLNPYTDGYAKMIIQQERGKLTGNWQPAWQKLKTHTLSTMKKEPDYIPVEVFKQSRTGYQYNNFIQWLTGLFNPDIVSELISRYHIGTAKHWNGAVIFWQIDQHGKVRTGKIMLYNPATGKRVKEPCNHITWVHKALKLFEFNLQQCYFGEHLLQDTTKPVALVESEKTAIIASVYLPQFIWLAVGSLTNLNPEKCQVLTGRNVVLFPDLNGFEKWSTKTRELAEHLPGTKFKVSDLLERKATNEERKQGLDIADFLIKFNLQNFQSSSYTSTPKREPEKHTLPGSTFYLEKEFYHWPFEHLSNFLGLPEALKRVHFYQGLSKQYSQIPSYVVHNSALLRTYKKSC